VRICSGGVLHWLKHNACKGVIARQKTHPSTNRHLNKKEEKWKTGPDKDKDKWVGEGSKEGKYAWCTFLNISWCTRMDTEFLKLLKSPKEED
jgi:hypothetical protein